MIPVAIIDIPRPALDHALALRGMRVAGREERPAAVLARAPDARAPTLVEARDADHAAAWLDAGADDVVLGADRDALVAARLAALARRGGPLLRLGDLTIDPVARAAMRGGKPLALLPREYALLVHLAAYAGATVARDALHAAVLGLAFDPGTNVLAVHVSRLRAKLHRPGLAPILVTDKGRGYRLEPAIAAGAAAG